MQGPGGVPVAIVIRRRALVPGTGIPMQTIPNYKVISTVPFETMVFSEGKVRISLN